MSRIKDFFLSLNKSTKITMLSCGCFIVLTLIILCFFVMFPITPSERAISSLGREGLVYQENEDDPAVTTAATTAAGTVTKTTTTMATDISGFIGADVTTFGTGYLSGNLIPTGTYIYETMPIETTTTTVAPGIDDPSVSTTGSDIGGGEYGTTTAPGIDIPPVTDVQPTDPPVDPTDPPVDPTDSPAD